jgi:hypothetical protein
MTFYLIAAGLAEYWPDSGEGADSVLRLQGLGKTVDNPN